MEEVTKGGAALLIQSFALSSWGSDPVQRIGEPPSKSGVVLHKGSAGERPTLLDSVVLVSTSIISSRVVVNNPRSI